MLKEFRTCATFILILVLSLKVYGSWIDSEQKKEARFNWTEKSIEIVEHLADMVGQPEYVHKSEQEVTDAINNVLDKVYLLEYDADFRRLTREEQVAFYYKTYDIVLMFHRFYQINEQLIFAPRNTPQTISFTANQ